jgi:hypothetical protein
MLYAIYAALLCHVRDVCVALACRVKVALCDDLELCRVFRIAIHGLSTFLDVPFEMHGYDRFVKTHCSDQWFTSS